MIGEVVIYNLRIDRFFKFFFFFGGLKEFIWFVEFILRNIFVFLNIIIEILFVKKVRMVGRVKNRFDFIKFMIRFIAVKIIYILEVIYVFMKICGFLVGNVKFVYRFKVIILEFLVVFLLIIMSILERILR